MSFAKLSIQNKVLYTYPYIFCVELRSIQLNLAVSITQEMLLFC